MDCIVIKRLVLAALLVAASVCANAASVGTVDEGAVLGRPLGGGNGPSVSIPYDQLLSAAPAHEDLYPDDSSTFSLTDEGRDNARSKIALGTLLSKGRTIHQYFVSPNPQIISAKYPGDVHWGLGSGTVIFDIAHLSFGEDFSFVASSVTTVLLDPGQDSVFPGWGTNSQMIKLDPNQGVSVRRVSNGIFNMLGVAAPGVTGSTPGAVPVVHVDSGDLTAGVYTLPVGGGGKEYTNITGGAVTFDLTVMDLVPATVYWVSNNTTSTSVLDPGPSGVIIGLLNTKTFPMGAGAKFPVVRWSTNIYEVGNGTASMSQAAGFLKADLPIVRFNGMTVMCTDCRDTGETAGNGHGIPVVWKSFFNNWYDLKGFVALN